MYTELSLEDRIQHLHNIIREQETRHHGLTMQILASRHAAATIKDKAQATQAGQQARKDEQAAALLLACLPPLRGKLAELEKEAEAVRAEQDEPLPDNVVSIEEAS